MPALLLKLGPWIIAALLAGALLWTRADLATAHGDLKVADARVAAVTDANKSLAGALDTVKAAQADNTAIAQAVVGALATNRDRETTVKLDIGKALQNDPIAHAWSIEPVPLGVRAGLRAGQARAAAPR